MTYKQTKNRNETGSKPKFKYTFDGAVKTSGTQALLCQEVCRLTIFAWHCEKMRLLLPKIESFEGIPGPEAYQIKNEYAQRRRLRRI